MKTKVILPKFRSFPVVDCKRPPTIDFEIINELNEKDMVSYAPAGHYDDTFILKFAMDLNGLIISNDKFEEKQFKDDIELYNYYSKKLVGFV